jgi:hypothetical protein
MHSYLSSNIADKDILAEFSFLQIGFSRGRIRIQANRVNDTTVFRNIVLKFDCKALKKLKPAAQLLRHLCLLVCKLIQYLERQYFKVSFFSDGPEVVRGLFENPYIGELEEIG